MTKGTITTEEREIYFTIPDRWDEVTLKMFLEITKAEGSVDVLSAFLRLDKDVVAKFPHEEAEYIVQQLDEIFTVKALTDLVGDKTISQVTLNKETFKAVSDFGNLSYGQFEDMKKFSTGVEKGEYDQLHILLSIMLMSEDYDGGVAYARRERFKLIKITDAMMLRGFFLNEWLKYFRARLTASSSRKKKTRTLLNSIKQGFRNFKTGGERILASLDSQKKKQ